MAAPVRADIGERLEAMWDSVIDLFLISVLVHLKISQ